jgi:NAD(P)-dependent dehydrogenase (short-subunit alcohol dehydrogenase family)
MPELEKNNNQPGSKHFLHNKVMLIVGARNQLGLDLAQTGAELGAQIVLAGLEKQILKQAAKKLVSSNYKALFTDMNPTKPDEVANTFVAIKEKFKTLDMVFINLDFKKLNSVADVTWIELQNHLLMNFTAPFLCIQNAFKKMQRGGVIIAINSNKFDAGGPNNSIYSASKTALHQMLNVAREEAKSYDLRIVEVFINETSLHNADDIKQKKFLRDASRQILLASNPHSCAHQKELHIEFS